MVWYVGDASSTQSATVTINNADVKWWYNALEKFNITPALDENNFTGDKTFTISPMSMNTEVTETLTVTTADGMTDELVLKVVPKPVEKTVWLKIYYDIDRLNGNKYTGELTTNNKPDISVSDNTIEVSVGTYNNDRGWPLTIKNASASTDATITFSYEYSIFYTATGTVKISELLNGDINSITLTN